jgi:hypothetical protein
MVAPAREEKRQSFVKIAALYCTAYGVPVLAWVATVQSTACAAKQRPSIRLTRALLHHLVVAPAMRERHLTYVS